MICLSKVIHESRAVPEVDSKGTTEGKRENRILHQIDANTTITTRNLTRGTSN